MNYPPLNEKLLDCVMKHIEEHPEVHRQEIWLEIGIDERGQFSDCGTVACVAGWACLLTLPDDKSYVDFWKESICYGQSTSDPRHIKVKAREKLGLTEPEATFLFGSAGGSKEQVLQVIKARVARIKHDRGLK